MDRITEQPRYRTSKVPNNQLPNYRISCKTTEFLESSTEQLNSAWSQFGGISKLSRLDSLARPN